MDNITTGSCIKQLRKEKDMTQKQLADLLHITDRAVSKWERGVCAPDISLLEPLAEILEVSIVELIQGERAKAPQEAEAMVGHAVGGVCPFAVNPGVAVYLDVSLKRFETVFPACGSSNSAIELTIPELEECSGHAGWVDVCKGYQAP